MNTVATAETIQVLEEEHERELSRQHGARRSGDRFIQPLHHHNYATSLHAGQRVKIKGV